MTLQIPNTKIRGEDLSHLAELERLIELKVSADQLNESGRRAVKNLRLLTIMIQGPAPIERDMLASLPTSLKGLALSPMGGRLESLTPLTEYPELTTLEIQKTTITNSLCKEIGQLSPLNTITFYHCGISDSDLNNLQQLPHCSIQDTR